MLNVPGGLKCVKNNVSLKQLFAVMVKSDKGLIKMEMVFLDVSLIHPLLDVVTSETVYVPGKAYRG